jgi:hypothetical protein
MRDPRVTLPLAILLLLITVGAQAADPSSDLDELEPAGYLSDALGSALSVGIKVLIALSILGIFLYWWDKRNARSKLPIAIRTSNVSRGSATVSLVVIPTVADVTEPADDAELYPLLTTEADALDPIDPPMDTPEIKPEIQAESAPLIGTSQPTTLLSETWQLFATSKQGKDHLAKQPATPCQDSHFIQVIDDAWGVVVVCDGAGSQDFSQYGAAFVAEEIASHLAAEIPQTNIYKNRQLPSPEAWRQYCKALVLQTRTKLEAWVTGAAQAADETRGVTIRDVGCTLIWLVYTPMGLLTGHVGDGRAGYRDRDGWHALMTPWQGEYSNQTVFINSDSIYLDQLENPAEPDRPFMESRVIHSTTVDGFVLMSDGCESGLFDTVGYDAATNANININRPHGGICDHIIEILAATLADRAAAEAAFSAIVDEGNTALKNEGDDKTLLLGFLKVPAPENAVG